MSLRLTGLCLVLTVGVSLSGCGSADPAEVKDLASRMSGPSAKAGVAFTEDQATCRARVYLESDLSKKALAALEKSGQPIAQDDHDREELLKIADRILKECL